MRSKTKGLKLRRRMLAAVLSVLLLLGLVCLLAPWGATKLCVWSATNDDRCWDSCAALIELIGPRASPFLQREITKTDHLEWTMELDPRQLRSDLYWLLRKTGGAEALEFAHREVIEKCPTRADVDYLTPFDSPLSPWDVYRFLQVRGNEDSVMLLLDCIEKDYAYPRDLPMKENRRRYRLGQALWALALYDPGWQTPPEWCDTMHLTHEPPFTFTTLVSLLQDRAKPFGRLKNTPRIQSRANAVLIELSKQDFGFDARATPKQKRDAIAKWRAWLKTLPPIRGREN